MTYLDVVFRYGAVPGENEMRAIDAMREVYGIRRVQFNEKDSTVRVEFDASRLKQDAVAKAVARMREWTCGASGPELSQADDDFRMVVFLLPREW